MKRKGWRVHKKCVIGKKCPWCALTCIWKCTRIILYEHLYAYILTHNCWCACRSRTKGGLCSRAVARETWKLNMMLILFSGMLIRDIEMIPLHALTGCGMRVAAESNLAPTCIYFLGSCAFNMYICKRRPTSSWIFSWQNFQKVL